MFDCDYGLHFRHDNHGLFGWHTVTKKSEVVLTASEFDAMAVHQQTSATTLALPKGPQNLPQQVSRK